MPRLYTVVVAEITIAVTGGIGTALMTARSLAQEMGGDTTVTFEFNGRTFKVRPDTDLESMIRYFFRPVEVTGPVIGPHLDSTVTELDKQLALKRGGTLTAVLPAE